MINCKTKLLSCAKWIFTRGGILYLLLIIVSAQLIDFERINLAVNFKKRTFFKPQQYRPLIEILQLLEQGKRKDVREYNRDLSQYVYFYENVIEYFTERSDLYGLLGFCYYYLDEEEKAIEAFNKAITLSPNVFWYHYNLGAIYFNQQHYQLADASFLSALATKPAYTLKLVSNKNELYEPILAMAAADSNFIKARLQRGYSVARAAAQLSQKLSRQFPGSLNNQKHEVILQIF